MSKDVKDQSTVDCFAFILDGRAKNGGTRVGSGRKKKAFSTTPARIDERVLPIARILEQALADETIDAAFLDSLSAVILDTKERGKGIQPVFIDASIIPVVKYLHRAVMKGQTPDFLKLVVSEKRLFVESEV